MRMSTSDLDSYPLSSARFPRLVISSDIICGGPNQLVINICTRVSRRPHIGSHAGSAGLLPPRINELAYLRASASAGHRNHDHGENVLSPLHARRGSEQIARNLTEIQLCLHVWWNDSLMSGCGNVNIVSRRCINITHCANNNNNFRTSIAPNIHVQRRNKQKQGVQVVRSSH